MTRAERVGWTWVKQIDDSGESSAEEKARLRKCMGVHEGTENQNKTLLTQPASLEMLKKMVSKGGFRAMRCSSWAP